LTGPASQPGPRAGAIDPAVADELPGLRLAWLTLPGRVTPSPDAVVARLRTLSDRARGAAVVAMRTHPIPRAYRSFYRQIGLDPDVERIPAEAAATARLLQGAYTPADVIADGCLIAVVETGVPVWALDAAAVAAGPPGLGIALAGPGGEAVAPGSLCVADAARVHAPLFGVPLASSAPGPATRRVMLYAVGVAGVPEIHVHEALWLAAEVLGAEQAW
jgi:DNA/RNA-binding domain of Phe-tRNA-synthetase-like protein